MTKVYYSNKGGLGVILEKNENENEYIEDKEFNVNGQALKPNQYTNLSGMFTAEVRFVGQLKTENNCMVFCLGTDDESFESPTYYACFFWINENRIANKYAEHTLRDYNYKNGKWK